MDGVQTMLTGMHEASYYIVITSLERSMLLPIQLSSNVPQIEEFGGNA